MTEWGRTLLVMARRFGLAICDLDGTLVDSDRALADAFVALGVPREEITFGHVVADECQRWGIDVDAYARAYDPSSVRPFAGVDELIAGLGRWAVCSNKLRPAGEAELQRFGWRPDLALFADAFDGPKSPTPVLERLGVSSDDAVFVGDTDHDRACSRAAGVAFAIAAWNPRAVPMAGDLVLREPAELLDLLEIG